AESHQVAGTDERLPISLEDTQAVTRRRPDGGHDCRGGYQRPTLRSSAVPSFAGVVHRLASVQAQWLSSTEGARCNTNAERVPYPTASACTHVPARASGP